MKKVDRYIYPAVFGYEDDQEISVVFPDLDVATSGEDERGMNFSQVLQEALRARIGV